MADNFMRPNAANPVSMEIINSEQYKRANIRFSGVPSEDVRTALKNEGWLYSRNHNVWYPRNIATANSAKFAEHIKNTYFPEKREEVKIVTEATEKDELAFMIQSGSTLKEILTKLSDMYGENAVSEAFKEAEGKAGIPTEPEEKNANQENSPTPPQTEQKNERTELALQNKLTGEIFMIQKSDNDWDFTLYDKDLDEIEGGTTKDSNFEFENKENIKSAAKDILSESFSVDDFSEWEEADYNEIEEAIDYKEAAELAAKIREEEAKKSKEWAQENSSEEDEIPQEESDQETDESPFELPESERPHFDTFASQIPDDVQKNMEEMRKQIEETEPSFNINGETYTRKEIETLVEEDIQTIFRELIPEPYIEGIRLYNNPEKDGKIKMLVQFGTSEIEGFWREDSLFNALSEENITFNGMPVDVNPITPEKSGTIEEYLDRLEKIGAANEEEAIKKQAEIIKEKETAENEQPVSKDELPKRNIFTFEPFGYEGSIVSVETDLRRGIPAYDIVGISDGMVRETREILKAAIRNSGLELPQERILQSLSPADLRKESRVSQLAMALSILGEQNGYKGEPVLVLGELELSGAVRPVRAVHAAVSSARASGIYNVIVPKENVKEALEIPGMKVLGVSSLSEAHEKLMRGEAFIENAPPSATPSREIKFDEEQLSEAYDMNLDGYYDAARAIEIAIAGKHNILLEGAPGCGKTLLATKLFPALTPELTNEEAQSTTRIHSLAGLMSPKAGLIRNTPFRMPHQTASLEGICGGGPRCNPGEVSLAHNGILFLDEATEFRSSALQMLRIPLESKTITLSRAGRSTVYPANFQLVMASNPCPCGNHGNPDKICLCSERSINQYWNKFTGPLLDRVEIKQNVRKDENDRRRISVPEMMKHIENAFRIQRENEHYNGNLSPQEIMEKCKLNDECQAYMSSKAQEFNLSQRSHANTLKLALTIANMDSRTEIALDDLREAVELNAPLFDKPHEYRRDQSTVEFGGFSYNSYYHSTRTRDLCHDIKQTENPEKQANAIKEMAKYLSAQIAPRSENQNGEKICLVPAPQHTGSAEYTLEIANQIAALNPNCHVLDILKCEPHETLYSQKKNGDRKGKLNFYLAEGAEIPENTPIFFVDNVISSGNTFNEANKTCGGNLFPLVYSVSDFAKMEVKDGKVIITDTRNPAQENSIESDSPSDTPNDMSENSIGTPTEKNVSNGLSEIVIDLSPRKAESRPVPAKIPQEKSLQLTEEDLDICRTVIPPAQYKFTITLTQGEEGEFFKGKLKEIADTFRKINTDKELRNENETHDIAFRYFLGGTEIYISQIYTDGIGFGYTILNGDLEMSEWGDTSIEEILSIPGIEMDYHIPQNATIEQMLHHRHPDYFPAPETSGDAEKAVESVSPAGNEAERTNKAKPNYHFYVRDVAEFEAFQKIKPMTNLSAKEAVEQFLAFDEGENFVGIGIIVPGSIDHGEEFEGNGVAELYRHDGQYIIDDIFMNSHHSIRENPDYRAAVNDLISEMNSHGKEVFVVANQNYEKLKIETPEQNQQDGAEAAGTESPEKTEESNQNPPKKSIREEFPKGLYYEDIESHVPENRKEEISREMRKIAGKNSYAIAYDTLAQYLEDFEEAVNGNSSQDWETIYRITYDLTNLNFHSYNSYLCEYDFEKYHRTLEKESGKKYDRKPKTVESEKPVKPETSEKTEAPKTKGQIKSIREQCREILRKPDGEITEADKLTLEEYEGAGGIDEESRTNSGVLNEFYTPKNLVKKVWEIADHYAPNAVTVLEPSSGTGRFADGRPNNTFTMHEKDEVSARINKILHPNATVIEGSFQKQFFDENERFKKIGYELPKYDIVIGNPPYGAYNDKYKGLGEGKQFDRYEEYFIQKGLESLKDENSLLAFVVPSGFLRTVADKPKTAISLTGELIDAYRLPEGTFPTTQVGTDIVVFKKYNQIDYAKRLERNGIDSQTAVKLAIEKTNSNMKNLEGDEWFKTHPEKVLGEIKERTNRFGNKEKYVAAHEGLSIQNELDKISSLLAEIPVTHGNEMTQAESIDSINKMAEKYGYYFDYENQENAVDIYENDSDNFIGSLDSEGNFGFADDFEGTLPQEINRLAVRFYEIAKSEEKQNSASEKNTNTGLKYPVESEKDKSDMALIRKLYAERYPNDPDFEEKGAANFWNAWKSKDFKALEKRLVNYSDEANPLKTLFEKVENVKLPESHSETVCWLVKYADFNTLPNEFQFKSWDEALRFEINRGSGFSEGKKRIYEFFKSHGETKERASFLKKEYGISGGGMIGYHRSTGSNGIQLEVFINQELKERSFSWEEVSRTIATEILTKKYYSPQNQSAEEETNLTEGKTSRSIPENEVRRIYNEAYPKNPEHAEKDAEKFIGAWKLKAFGGLQSGLVYTAYPHTSPLRKLFSEIENVLLPDNPTDTLIWLSKYADYDTVPQQFKFKNWNDALRFEVSGGTSFENGKKRVYEFFRTNLSKKERAKFLKDEYGIGGGGSTGYQHDHDSKGLKLKVIINGEEKERLFSWEEVADTISYLILENAYYKDEASKSQAESKKTAAQPQSENASSTGAKTYTPPKQGIMTAQEFSNFYGKNFDDLSYSVWKHADWEGHIKQEELSEEEKTYITNSQDYVQEKPGFWTHKVLFESGDIYKKIEKQKNLLSHATFNEETEAAELHKQNIAILESVQKTPIKIDDIHIALNSTLTEEFMIPHTYESGLVEKRNLAESFILWAQGETVDSQRSRRIIDYATARISREDLPDNVSWWDIVDFIDGKKVIADKTSSWSYGKTEDEIKQLRKERKKEADEKRMARQETANRLFDRYMHEGLDTENRERFLNEYNRRFNSYVIPKYENLPLYIDGMNAYKGDTAFKLYDQQLKGVARLSAKGNGLLAYDVGVGKTATGIVANINQIQTGRSKRPLIIVPNSVYTKWVTDIKQLFPKVKVNELYNFSDDSIKQFRDNADSHKLNLPAGSISVCTYEALKHITFTDKSCCGELFDDFSKLLSADFDGPANENAAMGEKIMGTIGRASCVDNENYVFFEKCGFDNITVDEAHNFKNLWVMPKPKKKGGANEYAGIPSGVPSKRAIKLFATTQLIQRHNANRNVFLLTATPFTNSPVEVYSMLTYIGRERLVASGIYSLRDFMNQFAHTKLELAVNPKGEIDYKQVMKDWKELPALQNLLTEFIDKVDGEEAGIIRPKKFSHVKELDLSPLQKRIMEAEEERMLTVTKNSGAILEAMNNMRIALVSPALLNKFKYDDIELPDLKNLVESSPKLKFVCDAIVDMYKEHPNMGQFMYMPLGKEGHGIVADYLEEHGIPAKAIKIINGEINNTPEKKEKITAEFNDPKNPLKVIIGGKNTSEGIDLNGNSFAMYNCSLGWNPSETIQAEGRIWRQGNLQGHVHIVYPVMTDSIDSLLYQKHDEKRSRINDLWTYKGNMLNVEDINPEELKFDLIKDPEKRAQLILDEETKDLKAKLSKIKLRQESFDEIIEKRKEVLENLEQAENDFNEHNDWKNDAMARGERVPNYIFESLRDDKKNIETFSRQKEVITEKLAGMDIHNEEEIFGYVHTLNEEKHGIESEIAKAKEKLPALLEEMRTKLAEQKLVAHPIEEQRHELEHQILSNLRPMKDIIEEMKKETMPTIEKTGEPFINSKGEYCLFDFDTLDGTVSDHSENYDNGKFDDLAVTPAQIKESQNERAKIIRPILHGEKSGLWTAFKDFEEKGVFDVQGKKISLTPKGRISKTGWNQLQAAMSIYRNKKFETFRYVLIDRKTGEIKDQLALSAHMPNVTLASVKDNDTVKQVLSRAEEKDCLVVAVHNHPSGNTQPSLHDTESTATFEKMMRRNDGTNRFAGHIILDHDKFSLYTPKKGWQTKEIKSKDQTRDELLAPEIPEWAENSVRNSTSLISVAEKINAGEAWSDDFIPVVFTNTDFKITALTYIQKESFFQEPDELKKDLQESALSAGAVGAFPLFTKPFLEKLSGAEKSQLEGKLKSHIEQSSFVDAAIGNNIASIKFGINPGDGYSRSFSAGAREKIEINSTWNPKIDRSIFTAKIRDEKQRLAAESDIER